MLPTCSIDRIGIPERMDESSDLFELNWVIQEGSWGRIVTFILRKKYGERMGESEIGEI